MDIIKTFDNYYSNKKFDPSKPFVLMDRYKLSEDSGAWNKQKRGLRGALLFAGALLLSAFGFIFLPKTIIHNVDVFLENNVFVTVSIFSLPIFVVIVAFVALSSFMKIDSELSKTVSLSATEGIRESFVYALRGWLNARYNIDLTNDHVISLLVDERTPFAGEKYKLVFSDNKREIVDFVVDNSCPSGCCDKDDVTPFVLSTDTRVFKK